MSAHYFLQLTFNVLHNVFFMDKQTGKVQLNDLNLTGGTF